MKRIIEWKTYNTDTATRVARYEYENASDYDTVATIYVTKGGAFFVVHVWQIWENDIDEKVSRHYFEAISGDELDRLVTRENIEIIDENVLLPPPEAVDEVEPAATIYVRVPAPLKKRVDEAAAGAKLSANAWVMRCLENCLSA
jgi:hypothetical protein